MNANATSKADAQNGRRHFWIMLACLLGIMAALFHKALSPDWVLFNNDGPLGADVRAAAKLPDGFTGMWLDQNWLGTEHPATAPDLTMTFMWLAGPLIFAKVWSALSLVILGLCAWYYFRKLKFAPLACILGGLAAALNADPVGNACWGQVSRPLAVSASFLALALMQNGTGYRRWIKIALAGMAVGWGVMEGYDIGALFSLFVAACILFQTLAAGEGGPAKRVGLSVLRLAVVAGFAAFLAAQTVLALVGTQIKGIVGMEQDAASRARRWNEATMWSQPKSEMLGVLVPGLFGFRMDTPGGGAYWGRGGRDPAWDEYIANGKQGPVPRGFLRYGGGGGYAGALVVVVAVWAVVFSFRKQNPVYSMLQRRMIWFWLGVLIVSMLLAFGRFAPFYQFFYALPYASTIRNPAKFGHVFEWALVILFAYGAHGLCQTYMSVPATASRGLVAQWKTWWARAASFDRKWVIGSLLFLGLSLLAWMLFASMRGSLEAHLTELSRLESLQQGREFDPVDAAAYAQATASFSLSRVGRYILVLVPALALVGLAMCGCFAGKRAKLGVALMGILITLDLFEANLPWVVMQNWKEKYIEAGDNPVIARLRDKPYEHRVSILPFQPPQPQLALLNQVYNIEWLQHIFQYYNIQSIDIIQMPRVPTEVAEFEGAMHFDNTPATIHRVARRWELMNTRYLLGAAPYVDALNNQLDPEQKRFHTVMLFEFYQTHAGGPILARTNSTGPFALIEFTGALPRAKLYANWQVSTNDQATLTKLASKEFDPAQTVLVADSIQPPVSTNQNSGTVEFTSYAPKHIVLRASAPTASVLLLNDKYDPNWHVTVDGKPAPLLRCNYVMRGVQLAPGSHTVEFSFKPSLRGLYVSLTAIFVGVVLIGVLIVGRGTDCTEAQTH